MEKGYEGYARGVKEIINDKIDGVIGVVSKLVTVNDKLVHVKVGDVTHPMEEKHYIEWVLLVTNLGKQRKQLKPGNAPEVTFALLEDEKPLEVYEYCNLHGLWKIDIK